MPAEVRIKKKKKKSLPDFNELGGAFAYFAGRTSLLLKGRDGDIALEWRTMVWPCEQLNLYMQ